MEKKYIYGAVGNSVDKIGGFNRCRAIATDGAPAMIGVKCGFVGLLREYNVTCPAIHCIIHQEVLCHKSVKQSEVFKVVNKVINMIRGINWALLQRELKQFLQETEAGDGDLILYNHMSGWAQAKILKDFSELKIYSYFS